MKKYLSLLLILLLSITFNVKADGASPILAKFELVVSNKSGATCYNEKDNKFVTTDKKIPYNKIVYLDYNYDGDYYSVSLKDEEINYSCLLNIRDLSLKNSSFSNNNSNVEKITPKYAVVLANGGLNLRKGPSTIYSKVTLVPKNTIIKLTHKAGNHWYYIEYNGKSGWITSMNGYLGYDSSDVLFNNYDVEIYSDYKATKKVGVIPKDTFITNYLFLDRIEEDAPSYYVNYNGIKGYISFMGHKMIGKINLLKDTDLYGLNDKILKKIKPGVYDYYCDAEATYHIYFIDEKGNVDLDKLNENVDYKLIDKPRYEKKDKGYIGEGLFGEKITKIDRSNVEDDNTSTPEPNNLIDVNDGKTNEVKEELKKQDKINNETIIIIVLASIVLALTITVIILLVNKKKNNVVIEERKNNIENNKEEVKEENENQFEEHNEQQNHDE